MYLSIFLKMSDFYYVQQPINKQNGSKWQPTYTDNSQCEYWKWNKKFFIRVVPEKRIINYIWLKNKLGQKIIICFYDTACVTFNPHIKNFEFVIYVNYSDASF